MRMRKINFADALYTGPGVDPEEVLDLFWPHRSEHSEYLYSFSVVPTKAGNQLMQPVIQVSHTSDPELMPSSYGMAMRRERSQSVVEWRTPQRYVSHNLPPFRPCVGPRLYVGDKPCAWPIIPVFKHRGGWFTSTAATWYESGQPLLYEVGGLHIPRPIIQVKHRQHVWRNREHVRTEVWYTDVIGRFVRTRHRVVYADRVRECLVIDTLLRPESSDA